jgi:creatinine amidohydrolase
MIDNRLNALKKLTDRGQSMTALYLDRLTWADIEAEIQKGRDTVVIAFGSTEQHGRHLPLGTDAVLGDELGRRLAERLGAFVAPTVRFGCSQHHLAFPGTISLNEQTFQQVVADVISSLSRHGFRRIVVLPTHGGNFKPLIEAVSRIAPIEGVQIYALTDLTAFIHTAFKSSAASGVEAARSGAHAGEWETSVMMALRPEQVKKERAGQGFVGELSEVMSRVFDGIQNLDENGVLGDPRPATAQAGQKYLKDMEEFLFRWVSEKH